MADVDRAMFAIIGPRAVDITVESSMEPACAMPVMLRSTSICAAPVMPCFESIPPARSTSAGSWYVARAKRISPI